MIIYRFPAELRAIIFDIDSTLYTNPEWAHEQVDIQIRHMGSLRGKIPDVTRALIEEFRVEWKRKHGTTPSLGNTLTHFGIPIEESVRWRETLLEPGLFLKRDPRLYDVLTRLTAVRTVTGRLKIAAVTNNPVIPARKTLEALGVSSFFPDLIGLDTFGVSKPHIRPFMEAANRLECLPEHCLSVGDRYDIDLALPLELGMGGILVEGVEDVYRLPALIEDR